MPVDDIRNKRSETVRQIVGDEVIQNVTGVEEITFADVENAQMLAEKTGESEDTISLLNRYIQESEVDLDKSVITEILQDVYREACEVE